MPTVIILAFALLAAFACCRQPGQEPGTRVMATTPDSAKARNPYYSRTDTTVLTVSDAEWKRILPADVYRVAREKDTEAPFTGMYWDFEGDGRYFCAVCGNALFRSDAKFASSCGWPSFFEAIRPTAVRYLHDGSFGMDRIEVLCGRCESHLGHIFDDGPPPTGKRFCMNSIVLEFEPESAPARD